MSAKTALEQTRAIPRQMLFGIIAMIAAIVVVAGIVNGLTAHHKSGPTIANAPLPERIAPVGRVELAAPAAPAAAPESAPPAVAKP